LLLVEVDGTRVLLGVSPGRIERLGQVPAGTAFATALHAATAATEAA